MWIGVGQGRSSTSLSKVDSSSLNSSWSEVFSSSSGGLVPKPHSPTRRLVLISSSSRETSQVSEGPVYELTMSFVGFFAIWFNMLYTEPENSHPFEYCTYSGTDGSGRSRNRCRSFIDAPILAIVSRVNCSICCSRL